MIRQILHHPHPILLQTAQPVADMTPELAQIAADMIETMIAHGAVGLAAPQIGESIRLCVVKNLLEPGRLPMVVFNPVITSKTGNQKRAEGCLSVPGIMEDVVRANEITVQFRDHTWTEQTLTVSGFLSVIFQHEIDHLDGLEFLDRIPTARRVLALKGSAKYRRNIK